MSDAMARRTAVLEAVPLVAFRIQRSGRRRRAFPEGTCYDHVQKSHLCKFRNSLALFFSFFLYLLSTRMLPKLVSPEDRERSFDIMVLEISSQAHI